MRHLQPTLLVLLCIIGPARPAFAQVYRLADMNTRQIALDFDKAPPVTAHDFADQIRIAKGEGWTGYFGAPEKSVEKRQTDWLTSRKPQ